MISMVRAVLKIHHQRRIDGVIDRRLTAAAAFRAFGRGGHRHDGSNLAVLVQFEVRKRMQFDIDEAAEHHGKEGERENAQSIHQGTQYAA
jgi:hypothetical protein